MKIVRSFSTSVHLVAVLFADCCMYARTIHIFIVRVSDDADNFNNSVDGDT